MKCPQRSRWVCHSTCSRGCYSEDPQDLSALTLSLSHWSHTDNRMKSAVQKLCLWKLHYGRLQELVIFVDCQEQKLLYIFINDTVKALSTGFAVLSLNSSRNKFHSLFLWSRPDESNDLQEKYPVNVRRIAWRNRGQKYNQESVIETWIYETTHWGSVGRIYSRNKSTFR